jgi:probable HAF family extracellular repeat protein
MSHRTLPPLMFLAVAFAGTCFADPVYSVTPVNYETTSVLLNNQGQYVVPAFGGAYLVNGYGPSAGQAIPITIPGATAIIPTGINDSDQVVGAFTGSAGAPQAFVYSNGQTTNLTASAGFEIPPGVSFSVLSPYFGTATGLAINNSGAIAGAIPVPGSNQGNSLGLYSQGTLTDLGLHGTAVIGINNSAQIAVADNEGNSWVFKNGSQTLPIPSWALGVTPSGINSSGELAGTAMTSQKSFDVAVIFTNGAWQSIGTLGGTLSTALGINDKGQVVGWSTIGGTSGLSHAFLYQNGTMTDLNSLLPPAFSGVTLFGATSINDLGQIVAFGGTSPNGLLQDYLLTPPGEAPLAMITNLPEPSTLVFFSLVIGGFCVRHAIKRTRRGCPAEKRALRTE